jgi:hypothetical protein
MAMKTSRKRSLMIVTGLIVLSGALYGCKDFLVSPPQGTLDGESLANRAGVEATLIGARQQEHAVGADAPELQCPAATRPGVASGAGTPPE